MSVAVLSTQVFCLISCKHQLSVITFLVTAIGNVSIKTERQVLNYKYLHAVSVVVCQLSGAIDCS
jgi:hypothetical protein